MLNFLFAPFLALGVSVGGGSLSKVSFFGAERLEPLVRDRSIGVHGRAINLPRVLNHHFNKNSYPFPPFVGLVKSRNFGVSERERHIRLLSGLKGIAEWPIAWDRLHILNHGINIRSPLQVRTRSLSDSDFDARSGGLPFIFHREVQPSRFDINVRYSDPRPLLVYDGLGGSFGFLESPVSQEESTEKEGNTDYGPVIRLLSGSTARLGSFSRPVLRSHVAVIRRLERWTDFFLLVCLASIFGGVIFILCDEPAIGFRLIAFSFIVLVSSSLWMNGLF